jgi:hypothetical protein
VKAGHPERSRAAAQSNGCRRPSKARSRILGVCGPAASTLDAPVRLRIRCAAPPVRVNGFVACLALCLASAALAQAPEPQPPDEASQNGSEGYSPPLPSVHQSLRFSGYVDVGFAVAQGNGSSFAPNDHRVPADYGSDPFQPAVNSLGEVASTDSGGRFANGFLPRSVGIGSRPSFLLNNASLDASFSPPQLPVLIFARAQLRPRFYPTGDTTLLELQQAFGKVTPFKSQELAISLGRFDSVFGIEYLDNESNIRTGITPSLIARYTTGHPLGIKAFYRLQIPALWSALSLNAAATNSGTRVEELMGPDLSLTGIPVGSARLGYELNLKAVQVKLGASGMYGPRNDVADPNVHQMAVGGDLRVSAFGVTLSGELIRLIDEEPAHPLRDPKLTGLGLGELASGFAVTGGYAQLIWALPVPGEYLTGLALYGRYDRRWAAFHGFNAVLEDRFTVGARIELFGVLALKAEGLFNRELAGAPEVPNDVFTTSAVFTW